MTNIRAISTQVPIVKAFTGAAMLALLGVLAVGVSGAQAGPGNWAIAEGNDDSYFSDENAPGDPVVCIVTGAAGVTADPVENMPTDTGRDEDAWDKDTKLMDIDSGPFGFNTFGEDGSVACSGADGAGEVIGPFADPDCEIAAGEDSRVEQSEYTNLILGTGHAEGTADLWCGGAADTPLVDPAAGGTPPPTDLKTSFSIHFVDTVGPLAITGCEGHVTLTAPLDPNAPGTEGDRANQDVDTCHGTGAVQITATDRDEVTSPAKEGVTGFLVEAAFEATLSGDEHDNTDEDGTDPPTPGVGDRGDENGDNEENEDL